jgi:hypothetical protein
MSCSDPATREAIPYLGGFPDDKLLRHQWCSAEALGLQVHFHDRLANDAPGPELIVSSRSAQASANSGIVAWKNRDG